MFRLISNFLWKWCYTHNWKLPKQDRLAVSLVKHSPFSPFWNTKFHEKKKKNHMSVDMRRHLLYRTYISLKKTTLCSVKLHVDTLKWVLILTFIVNKAFLLQRHIVDGNRADLARTSDLDLHCLLKFSF